jgi:rhodanese-related sulfurtransferase
VETLTTEELIALMKDEPDMVLIDVLGEAEYESEHIPGSFNAPVSRETFEEDVEELVDSVETVIVVYSADEESEDSRLAARKLTAAGFANVYDYEGGLRVWLESGRDVDRGLS